MAIKIIGSTGYIGSKLIKEFEGLDVIEYADNLEGNHHLDLANLDSFDFDSFKNDDIIFLLAAISSPDVCSNQYDFAYKINVTGTKKFIEEVLKRGSKVIFFSSDVVYGDQLMLLDETSICYPNSKYGEMKHEIETTFKNESNFKVIRLSYIFSEEDKYSKYLKSCYEKGNTADIFDPLYRNMVCLDDLLAACKVMASDFSKAEQITNISGSECLSRLDVAKIVKVKYNDFMYTVSNPGPDFYKSRPERIETSNKRLEALLDRETKKIDEKVGEFLWQKEY